jgi:hypothetical protein
MGISESPSAFYRNINKDEEIMGHEIEDKGDDY